MSWAVPLVFGVSLGGVPTFAYYALGGLFVGVLSFLGGFQYAAGKEDAEDIQMLEDLEGAEGFEMTNFADKKNVGIISTWLSERKKRNALKNGVVRWHIVGSTMEKPKYVKPEREEGGSIPEIEHEGQKYCFPDEAAVLSEEEGVPVIVHRKGEADPINLRDGWDDAIDAKSLKQYLELRVTSQAPEKGLLDGLGLGDYDSMALLRYAILGIVGLAIVWEMFG